MIDDIQMRNLTEENTRLNEKEYLQRKIELESYPQAVFVQIDGPCNHNCIFCSRPEIYSHFDLDEFRRDFEEILFPVFQRVNRINLTGSGELLFLPEAKRNLSYFNQFRNAGKMFATNGSSLTPKMVDFIIESGNRYVVHISLHSSNADLHRAMTGANDYQIIMENLKYLRKAKRNTENLQVNFIFVATTRNIENLVDFVRFSYDMDADGIIVYYHYVYRMDQKDISCYFDKELTNKILSSAKEESIRLREEYGREIHISLPPEFGVNYEQSGNPCKEAWSQVMVNAHGDTISCDVAGDSFESIGKKKDFMEVWNGDYYTGLRRSLVEKKYDCARYCFRSNKNTVNNFESYIIKRGRSKKEIEEFLIGT